MKIDTDSDMSPGETIGFLIYFAMRLAVFVIIVHFAWKYW